MAAEKRRRDSSEDRHERKQPQVPPAVDDTLVGRHVEYQEPIIFADGHEGLHWFSGEVLEVFAAKGKEGKRTGPFARIRFDAQEALGEDEPTEKLVALTKRNFNRDAKDGWRLDLDYEDENDA